MRLGYDIRALQCAHKERGIGRYTAGLLRALAAADDDELFLFHLKNSDGVGEDSFPAGCTPISLPLVAGRRAFSINLAAKIWLPLQSKLLGLETLIFPQGIGAEAACAIPARLPCPYIVVVHDLIPLRFARDYPSFANSNIYRAQCRAAQAATALIADSECTKRDLVALLGIAPERVRVIYPGLNPVLKAAAGQVVAVQERLCLEAPYFLAVGGYDKRKNLAVLLRAFMKFRQKSRATKTQLVLVERRSACLHDTETAQLLDTPGIKESVVFIESPTDATLAHLYRGARAFVFPSRYEGFGLPALEAMACGAPVLCARAGSLPEVGGEVALYFDPDDIQGLAELLFEIDEDETLRRDLSARGKARAARFNWENTVRQILGLCREVQIAKTQSIGETREDSL